MESNNECLEQLKDFLARQNILLESLKRQVEILTEDQFPVFTGDQIIEKLNISKEKLAQFHKYGLEHIKVGHTTLHTREDILKFYNRNKNEPTHLL